MSAQAEARTLIEMIAGPLRLGENIKAALARVARSTGLGNRRVRAIWHREARRIDAAEMDCLRRVAADSQLLQDARHAHRALRGRIEAASAALRLPHSHLDREVDAHGTGGLAGDPRRTLDR